MKKRVSLLLVVAMLLSMLPLAVSAVEARVLCSVTNEAVTAEGYICTFDAETTGTLNVSVGTCSPGWQYKVLGPNYDSGNRGKYSASTSCDYTVNEAGQWKVLFYAYSSAQGGSVAGTVSFTVSFTPAAGETEAPKAEYEVADTQLVLGDNALTLLDTAETTIYVFEPAETAVYTFTAPEGATLGYWGAGSWYLSNPNSTSNTYEWTCTGVGQKAYMGVSGVDGEFNLNVAKTGDYTVVETPIVPYENKATLEPFTLPEGAKLGDYVDVYGDTHTAVLGDDGYYHLDSVDGDVLLVDMDYQDIILSAALKSDRPVMYAYTTDADGNKIKYDIGNAVLEYEAVMDANGYYPLTEDLILFYDTYAVGAGTYTFHVSGNYNEDCVWMYCMRTMKLAEVEEPTEPSVPESSEPETEPSEPSVPESSEPEVEPSEPVSGTVVLNEAVIAAVASKYVYTYIPAEDGTLTITVGDGSTTWSSDLVYFQGATMNTVATANGSTAATYSAEVTANTSYRVRVWNNSGALAATPLTVVFTPAGGTMPEPSEPETEPAKDAYAVSTTTLRVGSNTVSMIPTAEATIFKFTPAEAGTYIITGPEGSKVGIWGYSSNLNDPNSTSNSCELNLANTGPTVRVGVTGVEGDIVLTIEKQEEPTEPSEPETEPSEPSVPESSEPSAGEVVFQDSVTGTSSSKYVYTYTPAEDGILTITVGDGSASWSSDVVYFAGVSMTTVGTASGTAADSYSVDVVAGTSYRVRVWTANGAATPLSIVFNAAGSTEPSEPETEPTEPSVPDTEPTEPSEPETEPSEPEVSEGVIFSGTDVVASPTAPVTHTWTAQANGTLTVTMSGTPGWKYTILQSNGETLGLPKSSSNGAEKTATFDVVAGETYTLTATGFNSNWDEAQGMISYTMTFTPEEGSGETVKEEYLVSDTALQLGDNVLTLLDSAVTTIYVFEPTETAVYTFTAPEGAILGYWGAGSWFLSNPNSTTNTYEWTCTGVGQSAYMGVSGVDGEFTLTVTKTGDYEVVETPIVKYENKAELNAFTVPAGATLGAYVDVFGDTHTAVLGDDGYYHLDSVDGPILLIDMDYMDIILSAALQSDRPVMYAYMYDENGKVAYKYDIGDAVKAYEAVMDTNGYYPVTEDILLFYQVYAVQAGTYTFHVSGDYNEDCVWMYCMRTMTLPEPAVAQVGDTQYATLAEAIAAANGNTVMLLADCADVTIAADVTIDLAGFNLTGVTVAEGATLYLVDSATDDYEGAYGTAQVTGNVASKVTVNGKNYLVVNEDGKYSAHCYALEITHISLKPGDDALGYKAKLYGDEVVQSKVTGFGFNMGAVLQKTFEKDGAPVNGEFTLRLQNIMAANGGDMEITASAFVRFGGDMETTEETKTTMKDTIKAINNMELNDAQKAAVYELYAKYADVMDSWFTAEETNNIVTWAP